MSKGAGVSEGAAWTKKSGKNQEGGLNEKGRKSYERENPGSDLKAPQPGGGSRKKSFCARMGGMKKKLTSSKTANDPDSRINKSLRKWKCNEAAALKRANINYTTTKKGGKTTHHVNKNDEADAQAAMKNDPKYIVGKTRVQSEAKVEKNRSDFGKASVRNKRKYGTEGEPLVGKAAIFRQKGDRGDLIDKRREEHKAKRGVKTKGVSEAKVDTGKSPEGKEAARNKRKFGTSHNQAKTGALRRSLHNMRRGDKKVKGEKPYYGDGGYAAEGAILDIVRKGLGKHKDAIQKRKVAARKATPYAAMAQSYEPQGNMIPEEGYDRMRDDRLVKYGIGHDGSDRRSTPSKRTPDNQKIKGKTVLQKQTEKKYGKGATAMDVVKAKIKAGKL